MASDARTEQIKAAARAAAQAQIAVRHNAERIAREKAAAKR